VLPLVAGLFVLVEALNKSGLTHSISAIVQDHANPEPSWTGWMSGIILAFTSNLTNNLPAGLIAGNVAHIAHISEHIKSALLIGVDVGPNLSVTGSLATILWLTALRREGQHVSAWTFLKLGCLVMPPALLLAIGATFYYQP
jgi:arsenical pump membrane protein